MILIDYSDRRPVYEQVTEKLAVLIAQGALQEGEPLPSVRGLAVDLSINPNTVQRAYQELERRGYIRSVPGKGSYVSPKSSYFTEQQEGILSEQRELAERAARLGMDLALLRDVISRCEGGTQV